MMQTKTRESVEVRPSRRARVYARVMGAPRPVRYLVALVLSGLTMIGGLGPASATDTTGTTGLFSGVSSQLTGTLIPAVVGIVLIGSLFWLGLRWYQKGKNAGNK